MRFRAVISYDGAPFVGWQRQLNGHSVQEALETALETLFGVPTSATASGRTDAGVHAEGQAVHFDAETSIPPDKIPFAVNTLLPRSISMLSCEPANDDFNARFSAKLKTYRYQIYVSSHRLPLLEADHAHIVVPLNAGLMKTAAAVIEGTHDFRCFCAAGSQVKSTIRTLTRVCVEAENENPDGIVRNGKLYISVTGNGFLYNMVRIIAGTLVYVGENKLSPDDVTEILKTGDRTKAGKTMPPEGLVLVRVEF